MFDITNDEKLRDAYALLMFMQKDVPASSKKKANVKNLAATVKREIRSYNNRPASNVRILSAATIMAIWIWFGCPMNWTGCTKSLLLTGSATTAIWKLTTANMTAQGRSSRTGSICSGGMATGLHTIRCAGMSEEVERMAKYTIDAVLEVWGSFDVEADNLGEAYRKAGENPGKYADLKVWNDGAEAQLRTYSHINCIGEYDVDDAVAALTGKEAKKE